MRAMPSSLELLQRRERLRVGERFLRLRPKLATLGALGNAGFLALSAAPALQKSALAAAFAGTVGAFWLEAWWLGRHRLTERWLLASLAATLGALSGGALLSGGLTSPVLPLLFAPVVVGFAAFARARVSAVLWLGALAALLLLYGVAPLASFPALPEPALRGMLVVSSVTSFALLAVGVTGLVEAHTRIASELERMRSDMLKEAERRATSVEQLGAQVAHEVKNPLAAARGLVQLVARHVTGDKDQQRLAVVISEVDRAVTVLEDYLSFAKPLGDLAVGACDARLLLEDVAGVLEARAREKSVHVEITGEHALLWGDRQRLRDALLNLALNAVTALPEGGRLTLSVASSAGKLALCVVDDGPGIDARLLPRLGRPFVSQAEGGTGLGVMLAQSVARQHGGALRFESTVGAGTRAFLELPLDAGHPRAEAG
jgi:signal transduction histidine kinase